VEALKSKSAFNCAEEEKKGEEDYSTYSATPFNPGGHGQK